MIFASRLLRSSLYIPSCVDAVSRRMWVKPHVTYTVESQSTWEFLPSLENSQRAPPPQTYIPTLVLLDTLPLLMTSKLFLPALTHTNYWSMRVFQSPNSNHLSMFKVVLFLWTYSSFPSLLSSNLLYCPVMPHVPPHVMYTLFLSFPMCILIISVIWHYVNTFSLYIYLNSYL